MSQDQYLIFILLGVILLQGAFIMYSSHKFVNKLMSANYYDYKRAEQLPKNKNEPPKIKLTEPEGFNELGIL